jgi:hypothetical protein
MSQLVRLVAACLLVGSFTIVIVPAVHAGQDETDFDGPAAPISPAVISRDASGRATIRAVRIATPLRVDGRLDESLYTSVPPISDFIQQEPEEGAPATEKTEMWLAFDADNLYVAFRCWESEPDQVVANEMRRDGPNMWQGNDLVAFSLDTFRDRRNSFNFITNALGAREDGQVTNERQWNGDWNTVWDVRAGRFEGGWTAEFAIPFKSLRYQPGRAQIWGVNAFRHNRWKNEISYITHVPAARGQSALYQGSTAATLVGLEAPSGSRNLELKPYAISGLTTDRVRTPTVANDFTGDIGFDAKYGLTQNLTADFTYNTDFAQVEADEQQVNLTRFSLFFPEKRPFFLENSGFFDFGSPQETEIFFSRRIGIDESGAQVPINAGVRLSGKAGHYSLGLLNVHTRQVDDIAPANNFSVARVSREFGRRSSLGGIAVARQSTSSRGASQASAR